MVAIFMATHTTLWDTIGVFGPNLVELAKGGGASAEMMNYATQIKAHRTAASLNPELHAICDCEGRPRARFLAAGHPLDDATHRLPGSGSAISPAPRHFFRRCRPPRPCWRTGAMTPTGCETPWLIARSQPAQPKNQTEKSRYRMTSWSTDSATRSRTCSAN